MPQYAAAAQADYQQRQQAVKALLDKVAKALETHGKRNQNDCGNWGFNGDLGRVEDQLQEMLEFLGG